MRCDGSLDLRAGRKRGAGFREHSSSSPAAKCGHSTARRVAGALERFAPTNLRCNKKDNPGRTHHCDGVGARQGGQRGEAHALASSPRGHAALGVVRMRRALARPLLDKHTAKHNGAQTSDWWLMHDAEAANVKARRRWGHCGWGCSSTGVGTQDIQSSIPTLLARPAPASARAAA